MTRLLAGLFALLLAVLPVSGQEVPKITLSHPMDALTPDEIKIASNLVRDAGKLSKDALFAAVTLLEPPKSDVLAWTAGSPLLPRRALVIVRDRGKTREAQVDLAAKKVVSLDDKPGAHPMIMDRFWARARDAFEADPRFKKAIADRGISSLDDVFCTPNSAGYYPGEDFGGKHIVKIPCYTRAQKIHPAIPRAIEGLVGVVDAETGEVLAVLDYNKVALPPPPAGWGEDTPGLDKPLRPVRITAEKGGNIRTSGLLQVSWNRWSFHVRADKRAGAIVSLVRFNDGKQDRLMGYQMNVAEMFVPYMDPDANWTYRTFMDEGEFGLGYLLSSLRPGVDCPESARFFPMTMPNDVGGTFTRPDALCIFERPTGDPAWRHYSAGRKQVAGAPQIELVVRHIPTLGNYDYVVDYVFSPQGNITVRVGATGFDAARSVASKTMDDATAGADTTYGNLIAPYTVAPFHDHYFNFRLDLDVDTPKNDLVQDNFVPGAAVNAGGRKSLWTVKSKRYLKEGPLSAYHDENAGLLRVSSTETKNGLGQKPSLWLHDHHDDQSILAADDPPQSRAMFSAYQFWVTRFKPQELWAAGLYPNLSRVDDGLPRFVADEEPVTGEDLVVWYTMGFRHVTRPEDFPILPTFWHEMTIRPAFYFDRDQSMTFNPGYPKAEDQ